jgi:tetratricopeptide (TPR) repeat protein
MDMRTWGGMRAGTNHRVNRKVIFPLGPRCSRRRIAMAALGLLIGAASLVGAGVGSGKAQSPTEPESGIIVDNSQQLFGAMCALHAAGLELETSSIEGHPAIVSAVQSLPAVKGPVADALRQFYNDHKLADSGETLSRYISLVLVTGPPPKFPWLIDRDLFPPDVLAVESFHDILENFYDEAKLDALWWTVAPDYERERQRAESPVRQIVFITSAYLREIIRQHGDRTFSVYVEPMVGSRTNFRNFGDRYAMVIGGGKNLPLDEIRHAYLHFVMDPLPLRYRKEVEAKRPLLAVAQRAPRFPQEYENDLTGFVDECAIKAVEIRLNRLAGAKLDAELLDNDREGYILVRPFVAQLKKFEHSEPAMSLYFPDMVSAIDVDDQKKRFENFAFAPVKAAPAPATAAPVAPVSQIDAWMAEGDRQIADQNPAGAQAAFERVLAQDPGRAQAIYGLAVSSVMMRQVEKAQALFERLTGEGSRGSLAPPPPAGVTPDLLAWSHIYLGRIHDVLDERDQAVAEYRAAINVEGAPEAARHAAQRGLDAGFQSSPASPKNSQP